MSTTNQPNLTIEHLLAHRVWLRALARSLVDDGAAADDLVQDTWMAALRRPPRDAGAIRAWLRTVAKNLARDRHRVSQNRARREAAAAVRESLAATIDVVERAELQRELTRHVLALDEPYRTTVLLRFVDELPPRAVAERMCVPVETVRTRLRRALARLRESMGEERGDAWRVALLPMVGLPPGAEEVVAEVDATTPTAVVGGVALVGVALVALVAVILMADDEPPTQEIREVGPAATITAPAIAPVIAPVIEDDTASEPPTPPIPAKAPATEAPGAAPPIAAVPPTPQRARPQQPRAPVELVPDTTAQAAQALPGMAFLPATDAQPIGMDETDVRTALANDMGRKLNERDWMQFPFLWDYGFTFMTPQHEEPVPAFWIGRYEVTNAQWKVFLDADVNRMTVETQPDGTLRSLVKRLYGYDAEDDPVDAQRAGLYLLYRNKSILADALNPDDDPEWEPLSAWIAASPIPAGLTIEFRAILPPPYWPQGTVPADELNRPVRHLSWNDARAFGHWAGLRLARETEWERAARGDEGRRYVWGDEWNAAAAVHSAWPGFGEVPGPREVDSLAEFATPEGVHHLSGNVSEYVFDIARKYPGSKSKFKFESSSVLARGGSWKDEDYAMLAADRIWDMGSTQIGPDSRAEVFGFRTASYPQPGRDLALDLATFATEFDRMGGAAHWLPFPAGLSEKERASRAKRQPLQGFALERTAGLMMRDLDADAADHAYVRGPAHGLVLLPIKGVTATLLGNANSLTKWSRANNETAFVGALLATDNCTITLATAAREPIEFDMGDFQTDAWAVHDLGFTYQVGLWLVLRGDRVAVYGGDGTASGIRGKHLRGEPLGFLPTGWESSWATTGEAQSRSTYEDGVAALTVPLPMLARDGTPRRGGKSAVLTVRVPVEFR